jgi:hypothetical protein
VGHARNLAPDLAREVAGGGTPRQVGPGEAERHRVAPLQLRHPRPLQRRVLAGAEVVDAVDRLAPVEQRPGHVHAEETRGTRDQDDTHGASGLG